MSKGNTFENEYLLLLFNNTNIANVGDATGLRGSSTAGSLYVSLHTADPGEAGSAATNETAYTNYTRTGVARSGAGWTVSGNTASNAAAVSFPTCGVTGATITHFAIVKESSGSSVVLYKGALTASLAVSAGITPSFAIGQITASED
jgi:hypothetical protein